jgi:hypothetical protein
MKRFLCTVAVVAASLAVASVAQARPEGSRGGSGHHGSNGSYREYKPSEHFGYGKYGMKSFSWSHYRWSEYYRRYCYWSPGYGWYFYEPIHACYLPVSYYTQVYPEAAPTLTASAPTVNQQTTVVNIPGGPGVRSAEPPPIPTVAVPPAAAVQQTKVGAGIP